MKIFLFASVVALAGCGVPETCDAKKFGGPFCIPDGGVAPAGQKLSFEVVNVCVGGCGRTTLACEVTRDAGTITIGITGQVCSPPPGVACTAACALTSMKCELPTLEEGDYTLVSADQSPQTLKVRDAGTASCTAVRF